MSSSFQSPPRFDATDESVVEYSAVSPWAVGGLLLGLASAATLISPTLWFLPLLGVPLNGWALWQIALRGPALVGRSAAVWGLLLSMLFLVYVPAENYFYRSMLGGEARKVAAAWFQAVGRKDAAAVHRLMMAPNLRGVATARPDAYYKANPRAAESLRNLVNEPVMRTMFALGPAAHGDFYETAAYGSSDTTEMLQQTYSVTFDQDNPSGNGKQKTTFFVVLAMERTVVGDQKAIWHIAKVDGPVHPSGFGP